LEWNLMTMADWRERMDEFLKLNRKNILEWAWKISAKLAKEKPEKEFDKFKPKQDLSYKNDFDKLLEKIK
jgi:hypothetical protein